MRVHWLPTAASALDAEYDYLAGRNPEAARQVFRRIVSATRRLGEFPHSGRVGQVEGTRELVVPGLPYVMIYRVGSGTVEILRVFHMSRDWPSAMN
jgi:plasmid stabilization system protein ParE